MKDLNFSVRSKIKDFRIAGLPYNKKAHELNEKRSLIEQKY
jgi:hypothetical protein